RLVDVDRLHLTGLADGIGHRRRLLSLALAALRRPADVGAALLAVVGALGVDEAAFGTVNRHRDLRSGGGRSLGVALGGLRLAGEDLGELRDVVAGEE